MYRDLATALALSLALIASACGKDIENPDFPTRLRCSLMDDCKQPAPAAQSKPAAKPAAPPATVVRPLSP